MRRITVELTIFLLLSMFIVTISTESISINGLSFLEEPVDFSHQFSKIKHQISDRLTNYEEKISKFYMDTTNNNMVSFVFSPEAIELKDDAFHGSNALHFTEWWYFDVVFDGGYSAQMSVRVLDAMNQGLFFVFSRLDIYKNGILISHKQEIYPIDDFYASSEVPMVILDGRQVINGYIDEETGDWIYDLSFEIDGTAAYLRFIGSTKGWKGSVPGGEWGVILPRAEVSGVITLNYKDVYYVRGIGYHDHNWNVTILAAMNSGWFWGKINSNNFTITWANIMASWFSKQPLIVVNNVNGSYVNIEQENIQFVPKNFQIRNGMVIPTQFILNVDKGNVSIHVDIEVLGINHAKVMGVINYWRYHVRNTGSITVDSQTEEIDEIHMAELVRFY